MFLRHILPLLALFGVASCLPRIRHLRVNEAQVVSTGLGVYGLTDPKLSERNWMTVSIQGDDVLAIASNCSPTQMKFSSLPESDKTLISEAKRYIFEVQQATETKAALAKLTRSTVLFESNGTPSAPSTTKLKSFKVNDSSIVKLAGDYISIVQPNMPDNIVRAFLTGQIVTFVYEDGKVIMKPSHCLDLSEKQLVQQFHATLQLNESNEKLAEEARVKSLEEQLKERKQRLEAKPKEECKLPTLQLNEHSEKLAEEGSVKSLEEQLEERKQRLEAKLNEERKQTPIVTTSAPKRVYRLNEVN